MTDRSVRTQPTVDVHAHAILPAIEQAVAGRPGLAEAQELDRRRNGAPSLAVSGEMIRTRIPRLLQLSRRLADMDAAAVEVQLVSPSPSQYHYWADPETADQVTALAAAGIAELVAQAPDRLLGLGLAPLQHPDRMPAALDVAMTEHHLQGVEISTHAPGPDRPVELSDPRLEPFWTHAEQLGAIVFVHPFGCTLDERLDSWYLTNVVGQPVENAVALSHLIFGGVLDRHPALRLVVSHGGGYLPAFVGRMDHGWGARSDVRSCERLPSSYLSQLWFDSLVHTPAALRILIDQVGAERVLLGSDHPFDMGVDDPVDRVLAAGLTDAQVTAILGSNAASLGLRVPVSVTSTAAVTTRENS